LASFSMIKYSCWAGERSDQYMSIS